MCPVRGVHVHRRQRVRLLHAQRHQRHVRRVDARVQLERAVVASAKRKRQVLARKQHERRTAAAVPALVRAGHQRRGRVDAVAARDGAAVGAGVGSGVAIGGGIIVPGSIAANLGIVSSIAMSVGVSLAMSAIQQQFVQAPQVQRTRSTRDSGTRSENNMFGSLTNSTKADSPIALNYGNMRVAGQFLSGYILSQQHAKNDSPTIASIFNANQSPLSAEAEEAA